MDPRFSLLKDINTMLLAGLALTQEPFLKGVIRVFIKILENVFFFFVAIRFKFDQMLLNS